MASAAIAMQSDEEDTRSDVTRELTVTDAVELGRDKWELLGEEDAKAFEPYLQHAKEQDSYAAALSCMCGFEPFAVVMGYRHCREMFTSSR